MPNGTTGEHVEWVPKYPVNSRLARLPESPRKDGYVFGGWFNEPELQTRFQWRPTMAAGNNNFNIINEDRTLYAAWAEKEENVNWVLKYDQNFDEPFNEPDEWVLDDYSYQSDPIWGQNGAGFYERELRRLTPANAEGGATAPAWYRGNLNQFGGGGSATPWNFYDDLASFTEWRKTHTYGADNWLTVQQYTRGLPGAEAPSGRGGRFEARDGKAALLVDVHNDAVTMTNTNPLPPYYRIEVTVGNIEAGGRAIDPETGREPPISSAITTNDWLTPAVPSLGRAAGYNGYQGVTSYTSNSSSSDFRSAGPWDASSSPHNAVAENGIYFLGILEYDDVRPNNNLHIHHRRKVVFDTDNNRATKSAGTGNAGWSSIWNVDRFQGDGSRYLTMIWCYPDLRDINAMNYSTWATWFGQMTSRYYTYTQVGTQTEAVYMTDKYLPGEEYLFVIERTPEYYMLSMTGNWYHAGQHTYEWTKFNFGYDDPTDPRFNYGQWTYHFNQTPEELRGLTPPMHENMAATGGKVYFRTEDGGTLEYELWPADSGYPDNIIMGLPHINYYDSYEEYSNIKLYVSDSYLYSLDVSAGPGGSVSGTPAGDYNAVTDVSLTAVADPGHVFTGWTFVDVNKGLNLSPSSASLRFTMPTEDVKMIANFEKADANKVLVDISAPAVSGDLDAPVAFTLSIKNAKRVMNLNLTFEVDGAMLGYQELETLLADFSAINSGGAVRWTPKDDGIWEGNLLLMYLGGEDGFSSEAEAEIAKVLYYARKYGDATMKITGLTVAGLDEEGNGIFLQSEVGTAEATTAIVKYYSPYDLNKDDVIDERDLAMAQSYYGAKEGDDNWALAQVYDFNGDKVVDMLDLIDLFLHFT